MTTTDRVDETAQNTAIYVYGIVPGDVQVEDHAQGIGGGHVEVVREGDIAALVSPVRIDRPLGKPDDFKAHAELLDGTAAVAPVLPLRFGAVMTDEEAVATELLRDHHDEFAQALAQLEGHAEYVIKGRYDQQKYLSNLLETNEQARALSEDIRDKPEQVTRNSRMALGELIANALETTRQADTRTVLGELEGLVRQVNLREPTHEWDAAHIAVLAEIDRQADLAEVLERLGKDCDGLVEFRLLGPLASYDFVVAPQPEGQ